MSQRSRLRDGPLHERFTLVALRLVERVRVTLSSSLLRRICAAGALSMLVAASPAQASEATKLIERCAHGQSLSGFSPNAYREALKQMPTELVEYSECQREISDAERGSAGAGPGTAGGPGGPSNTPIPLTPTESKAVENAHSHGATAVRIGAVPIRPGVVHADIASAVSKLPSSLIAVLALLVACALVLIAGETRKRVHTRRNG